ncbi:MAG: ATP-grasp domain-containing protein [Candidatus Woesearchaeota archaeon]
MYKIDVLGISKTWETKRVIEEIKNKGIECEYIDPRKVSYIIGNEEIKCFYENKPYKLPHAIILRGGLTRLIKDSGRLFINYLEMKKVKIYDEPSVIYKDFDKQYQSMKIVNAGLNHPKTFYKINKEIINEEVKNEVVIKPILGSKGRGMKKLERLNEDIDENYIAQEFTGKLGEDIRVIVINGEVIGAMKRKSAKDEWRSNIALGGKGEKIKFSEELAKTAIKAQKALGMFFSGVDILEEKNKYIVLEVNRAPQFKEFETITKINVAKALVEKVLNELDK